VNEHTVDTVVDGVPNDGLVKAARAAAKLAAKAEAGGARFHGSEGGKQLSAPVVGMSPTPAGAVAGGAQPTGESPPDVTGALRRFGQMAAVEVSTVCDLPGPRAEAELWRLAADWKVKAMRVLTGFLFQVA